METMNVDEIKELLKSGSNPDANILLDDGEFCIQRDSAGNGLLLRVCQLSLLEEDDAECCGGYYQRSDGVWIINFCLENDPHSDTLDNVSAECDDHDSAVAALWVMRKNAESYRVESK